MSIYTRLKQAGSYALEVPYTQMEDIPEKPDVFVSAITMGSEEGDGTNGVLVYINTYKTKEEAQAEPNETYLQALNDLGQRYFQLPPNDFEMVMSGYLQSKTREDVMAYCDPTWYGNPDFGA